MKLYDFSVYAAKRDAKKRKTVAASEVSNAVCNINQPGSVTAIKEKVDEWFRLHKEIENAETHKICI